MPLGLGLGITKLKSLVSGLRVRFQGNATITAALDGILRELSADFVSNGTVTAALEAIKLLDVDFSGDGTLTADIASFTGLLDDYPNAAAAYSVRLLKSDYTGALVRIRKDTGGQPEKDFYPDENGELSLNSSDGGTTLGSWIGSNSGYVVTWYSQAGVSGRDATQSTAANQPQILSGGALITKNGKVALDFDGVNDEMSAATANSSLNSANSYSLSLVASINNNNSFETAFESENSGGIQLLIDTRTQSRHTILNGTNPVFWNMAARNNSTNLRLNTAFHDSGDMSVFSNGTAGTSSSYTGSYGNSIFRIGKAGGANYDGYISEFILWSQNEISNRTGIETNINDYFSIY